MAAFAEPDIRYWHMRELATEEEALSWIAGLARTMVRRNRRQLTRGNDVERLVARRRLARHACARAHSAMILEPIAELSLRSS
jgi:hypothetical protein